MAETYRISWETVGAILDRVHCVLEPDPTVRYEDLTEIGIDETSYKNGHKYVTLVTDHKKNQVVWVKERTGIKVLSQFCEGLTEEQRRNIKVVTCDGARWIKNCMEKYFPNAQRCVDPFHVMQWVIEATDEIRKSIWREAHKEDQKHKKEGRGRPKKGDTYEKKAPEIKGAKYAVGKNPENLSVAQKAKLDSIREGYPKLFKAWQMKEALRKVFHENVGSVETHLKGWISFAARCRIPEMKKIGDKIKRNLNGIIKSVELKISNARIESMNNKIKLMIRKAYGFRNIENLKSLILLGCSSLVKEIRPY